MPPSTSAILHRPTGRTALGFALAMTTVALWSVLPIGLKVALGGIDPLTLTWVRFLAATVVLGALLRMRGAMPPVHALTRRHWQLLAVAALGLAGNYGFYALGLHRTNAGTSQVVIQVAPMLLTLGGIFVFKERFGVAQWLGLAVLVSGLALFSSEQIANMVGSLDRYYAGLAFLVAGGVTWAAYGLAQKQLLERMGSAQIMLCLYVAGTIVFTPMASPARLLELSAVEAAALVFCMVNMLLSYASFSEALAHLEASRVSAIIAAVPLGTLAAVHAASLAAPAVFSAEPITLLGVVGAALVVGGSLMTSLGKS
ncbi:MAG: DMT family transporter [Candidatus Binatia bacterium]